MSQHIIALLLILPSLISGVEWNDPKLDRMWYFDESNPMNIRKVWDENKLTGNGTLISLLDDSVDISIPELAGAISEEYSYDYLRRSNRVLYRFAETHGTNMAGIVAGRADNGVCGVGVAPEASVAAVRLYSSGRAVSTVRQIKSLLDQGRHLATDVFILGYGAKDDGKDTTKLHRNLQRAIKKAALEGKYGAGSVLMVGTGSGGDDDDCQLDGYVNNRYTIAVQAVSKTNTKTWYSEHCTAAMTSVYIGPGLVAPSSTLNPGEGKCLDDVEGTAAAASVVAGVVALARQENPTLSRRTIQHLLVESSNADLLMNNQGWVTNRAGHRYHHNFGFGLIDAKKFVDMSYDSNHYGNQQEASCGPTFARLVNANEGVFVTDSCFEIISAIEHVTVDLTLTSSYRGRVEVILTSPSDTAVKLLSKRPKDDGLTLHHWPFTTPAFWGETSGGQWTLHLKTTEGVELTEGWHAELTVFGVPAEDEL